MTPDPTTRVPDEDFLSFIAAGLSTFGRSCTLRIEAAGAIGRIAFASESTWSNSKSRTTTQGESR
jgi:hypothetical protein